MAKKPRPKMNPLERAINLREHHIRHLRSKAERILEIANDEVSRINKMIAERQVLLDALKRGALKP